MVCSIFDIVANQLILVDHVDMGGFFWSKMQGLPSVNQRSQYVSLKNHQWEFCSHQASISEWF